MIKDAEANAADDQKFEKLVTVRNSADGLVHATRKTLEEAGDKVEAAEKETIEAAIIALEVAIKSDDVDDIEAKTKALTEASAGMAEKMYADAQAQQQTESAEQGS